MTLKGMWQNDKVKDTVEHQDPLSDIKFKYDSNTVERKETAQEEVRVKNGEVV